MVNHTVSPPPQAIMDTPIDSAERALDVAGMLGRYIDFIEGQRTDESKELRVQLKTIDARYKRHKTAAEGRALEARMRLQELAEAGALPVQGLATESFKLVEVKQKRPVLVNFDDVPDDLLLPPEQWIDWKKVDDAVGKHAEVNGFDIVETTNIRIVQNKAVQV